MSRLGLTRVCGRRGLGYGQAVHPQVSHANESVHSHSHAFGQDLKRSGEGRTLVVILLTAAMMVVEVATGLAFGSMALLADGLHMASHAAALGIALFAYVYARRHAHDRRFSFGTGKVNALGAFSSAVLLAVFALMMVWESVHRLLDPVAISFDQAIAVAVVGLIVNGISVAVLGHRHDHGHGHDHPHAHEHDHPHHDQNLRAAYFHVLADALTSLLAIFALLAAKYLGLVWMDPMMGIVGAALVARWSLGLLRQTSRVLLDHQVTGEMEAQVRGAVEAAGGVEVTDLHLWSIGPGIHAGVLSVRAAEPRPPEFYKKVIPNDMGLVHLTVEVNH